MKVEDVMTVDVKTCATEDKLNRAAQLMWEGDLGERFPSTVDVSEGGS